jgi:hypothetical protein
MYFGNTSANTLTLGPLTVYPITFTVCSDDTVIEGTYNQKISFSGASSPVVQGNVNSINVTISGIPVPTFSVDDPTTDVLSGERFSNITITANAGGTLYYLIKETDETTTSVSFTALKVNVTVNKLTIESQRDYLTRIYDSPRDRRIGAIAVSAGNPTDIVFSQYFPGTNYLFCGYLQTKDESSRSNLICRRIVTPP